MLDAGVAFQDFRHRTHFGSLDGVRALSIIAVVWHHSTPPALGPALAKGFLGVDIFFVLSGFLITTLLLRERARSGTVSLRGFYIRRSLRIFPLYFGVILGLSALFALRPGSTGAAWFAELPYLLTYTTNWLPITTLMVISWSLSAEEQFYFVWPPIERWLGRHAVAIGVGLVVASQAIQLGALDDALARVGFGPDEPEFLRQTTFTPILLGVLLAHTLDRPQGFAIVHRLVGGPHAAAVVLGALVILLQSITSDLRGWERPTLQLSFALFVASVVVREDHALRGLLHWVPLQRIGVVSYGMYLLHMIVEVPVGWSLRALGLSVPGLQFVAMLLLTWALAELSFRYYESPFLRLKSRLQGHRPPPGHAAPA